MPLSPVRCPAACAAAGSSCHHPPRLAVQLLFIGNERPEIQLASVMYNATTDDEEHLADDSDVSKNTDIA